MAINCTTNPVSGCVSCPEIEEVEAVPGRVLVAPDIGWNAGANSIASLNGDLRARKIKVGPGAGGVVIGFRYTRDLPEKPELIRHGLAFMAFNGVDAFRVIENGVYRTAAVTRGADDSFEIHRVGRVVSYWRNRQQIHVSALASAGPVHLTSSIYVSGDRLGESSYGDDE